eukprot:scaffold94897_cov29-Attheya_sp.AAC.1
MLTASARKALWSDSFCLRVAVSVIRCRPARIKGLEIFGVVDWAVDLDDRRCDAQFSISECVVFLGKMEAGYKHIVCIFVIVVLRPSLPFFDITTG